MESYFVLLETRFGDYVVKIEKNSVSGHKTAKYIIYHDFSKISLDLICFENHYNWKSSRKQKNPDFGAIKKELFYTSAFENIFLLWIK